MDAVRDKVVIITGGTAGVGRATAHRFAREGARIGLLARDPVALEETRDELLGLTDKVAIAAVDVSDADAVFGAADELTRELGPMDVWINNAMLTVFAPVSEIRPEEFRRVTETTYLGYVYGTMAALRHMQPQGHGKIVQVGSSLAYRGLPLQAAYCGAKHAILGFTNSLRSELIHERSGIDVTMVHLPAVNTPQFDWARTRLEHAPRPAPPVIQPEVAADAIYKAALGHAREYWLGLSTAKVILANMVVPGWLDRRLARDGYDAQMRKTPALPGRRDNLTAPVHDLHRLRGSFGSEARTSAALLRSDQVRLALAGAGLAALAASVVGALLLRGPAGRR